MTAPLTVPKPVEAPEAKPEEKAIFDFNAIYGEWAKRGYFPTEEEKKYFEESARRRAAAATGFSGESLLQMLYEVLKFFALAFNPTQPLNGSTIGDHVTQTLNNTPENGKLFVMQRAMEGIYEDMRAHGGTLAAVASLTTQTAPGGTVPEQMENSLYAQAFKGLNIQLPYDANPNIARPKTPPLLAGNNSSLTRS